MDMQNIKPYAAGRFYPSDKKELLNELKVLFDEAVPSKGKEVLALISPHAGYVFSGKVAASSYQQLQTDKEYDRVFVIASSHRVSFHGASVLNTGNYETPLGEVLVDKETGDRLIRENELFHSSPKYHQEEHSLEVQLPFLQYVFGENLKIVPVIIGTDDLNECKELAKGLMPFFNDRNLFVFSSDFSHYPSYEDAKRIDRHTMETIVSNNPNNLLRALIDNNAKEVDNLITSLCGWASVLTLMFITENKKDLSYEPVLYMNSGDSEYGEQDRVVGYYSIIVCKEQQQEDVSFISDEGKKKLLDIARKTILYYIKDGKRYQVNSWDMTDELMLQCGVFVTLKKGGHIRGCIGRFNAVVPVCDLVSEMALAASTEDHRFDPVSKGELSQLDIEISLISPLKKIEDINEIEIGKHGVYIKKGIHSGTFLPEVAVKMAWNVEEFLGYCCTEKMGLEWDEWKSSEVFIYESLFFSEQDFYK